MLAVVGLGACTGGDRPAVPALTGKEVCPKLERLIAPYLNTPLYTPAQGTQLSDLGGKVDDLTRSIYGDADLESMMNTLKQDLNNAIDALDSGKNADGSRLNQVFNRINNHCSKIAGG